MSGRRDELSGGSRGWWLTRRPYPARSDNKFYKADEDPDLVVEIGEWESAEAREAAFGQIEASGGFAPMYELLAAPLRVTVLDPTH